MCARPALPTSRLASRVVTPALKSKRTVPISATPVSRKRNVNIVNAAAGAPAPVAKPFKWGADMKNLAICIGIGAAMWFCPAPQGVSAKAWHLLSIFTGTCPPRPGPCRVRLAENTLAP